MAEATRTDALPLLIFDGDCGICTSLANWARRWLPPHVRVRPWQRIGDLERYGLTRDEVETAAYWVDEHGRGHRGHEAVAQALLSAGGVWRILGRIVAAPALRPAMMWLYDVVARNRHRLPGATPACRLPE